MAVKNILIIHKDDSIRREMHRILSDFDFKLTYADDGLHGLYAVKAVVPDLIISAVKIPILNGLDLGKMIRNDAGFAKIPLIFLHEEMDLNLINKGKEIAASAFLIAPYLDNSLIYAIKRALHVDGLKIKPIHDGLRYEDCQVPVLVKIKYA